MQLYHWLYKKVFLKLQQGVSTIKHIMYASIIDIHLNLSEQASYMLTCFVDKYSFDQDTASSIFIWRLLSFLAMSFS